MCTFIDIAVAPKAKADTEKLRVTLACIAEDDPGFRVKIDEESGQTIISGTGESHLDTIVERLQCEFGVVLVPDAISPDDDPFDGAIGMRA